MNERRSMPRHMVKFQNTRGFLRKSLYFHREKKHEKLTRKPKQRIREKMASDFSKATLKTTEHIVRDPKSTHQAAHSNLNFLHHTKTAILKIWLNCKLAHKTKAMMMSVPVFRSHNTIYVGGLQSSRGIRRYKKV